MIGKNIVVIGGVAGGMSFATRYRRLNQGDNIIVIDKGPYVSFANCGLPYYVSGEISNREDLIVADAQMLQNRFQLDIRANTEAISINPEDKTITVVHDGIESIVKYHTLVLSPGAKPINLKIDGMEDRGGIYTLRNIPDVDAITAYVENEKPKSAVVIGAGFIGLEMAENLKLRGLEVSVVEKAPHVLPPFDIEMAAYASSELKKHDINLYEGTSVIRFEGNKAILEDGTSIDADLVIMSAGVVPETTIAKEAGIELGMRGGIVVDENYKTTKDDIYAVGDAIIVKHTITKEDTMIPLASPANRQGRQLADILSGIPHNNKGSLGTAIVRIFDLTLASTGLNERQLKGRDYQVMHLHANDHAGYFPNATAIKLKVIFDSKTHEILGAQALGEKGVDKRIDVIATAIKAGMKVQDLQELELSYAPPFGSAKDIVNLAGYVAQNMIQGTTEMVQWHEVKERVKNGAVLVDVRYDDERQGGIIPEAIHMSLDTMRCNMHQLPQDRELILFCETGIRSYNAELILKDAGYNAKNMDGSFLLYSKLREEGII